MCHVKSKLSLQVFCCVLLQEGFRSLQSVVAELASDAPRFVFTPAVISMLLKTITDLATTRKSVDVMSEHSMLIFAGFDYLYVVFLSC